MGISTVPAFEFQLQFAIAAEELRGVGSCHDLRRMQSRVEAVLAHAVGVTTVLEPRGWRVLTVRFEEEVCVVLAKHATAETVKGDLAQLPASVVAEIGDTVRICATVGEHIFEMLYADGSLRPLSRADVS